MSQAKPGDTVRIHFTGKTKDGEVFATSHGDEPLEFKIGEGYLLPGIERAVQGMQRGEQKKVTLEPQEGYGERCSDLILNVEKNQFPEDFEPQIGMQLQVPQPDGSYVIFKILEVQSGSVQLDANHPLAGETLTFELELLEID